MKVVTASEMREIDRKAIEDYGISGCVLMENAGRGAADAIEDFIKDNNLERVLVIAGKGNNGGDGFVVARHLVNRGIDCTVLLAFEKSSARCDAAANLDIALKMEVDVREPGDDLSSFKELICRPGIIVDALLGTGLNQDVSGSYREIIEMINRSGSPVVSLDIPSGLNATTGRPMRVAVEADMTVTFCLPKLGLVIYPGADYTGELVLVDIGAPYCLTEDSAIRTALILEEDVRLLLAPRRADTHKGTYGHTLIVAGSAGKSGAALMAAMGAMRTGAGLVTVAAPSSINPVLESSLTEVMTEPLFEEIPGYMGKEAAPAIIALLEGKAAAVIGPGISRRDVTCAVLLEVLGKIDIPVVLDADALWHIAGFMDLLKRFETPLILTPHPGEMARLLGVSVRDVQADRIGISRRFAAEYGCYLVLKGARTVVAAPDGDLFINTTGNPGMATAGAGDVLSGMIGAFLSQGFSPLHSCIAGVFLHGKAGDTAALLKGERGLIATDIIELIPDVIKEISTSEV